MTPATIPPADEDLVFICGALRSGTTLLRLMVNHHPALSNPGEMDFLFEAPPLRTGVHDMAAYARELSFNRVFAARELTLTPGLAYADQVRDFVRQLRRPGKRLSINIHRNFGCIPSLFPKARYVHLLRDPRDVAKSSIGMGWAGGVYFGVDHWIASERDFERLARAVDPSRIHAMTFEGLLTAPEAELARLCAFFGVAYDGAMLSYPSRSTYGPPDPSFVQQWRRELSDRELALVEGKLGPLLEEKGYARSGVAPARPGRLERFALRQSNRIGRWRFSLRRNGAVLTLLDLVSRRLPFPAFRDFVRRRLARRELLHLK